MYIKRELFNGGIGKNTKKLSKSPAEIEYRRGLFSLSIVIYRKKKKKFFTHTPQYSTHYYNVPTNVRHTDQPAKKRIFCLFFFITPREQLPPPRSAHRNTAAESRVLLGVLYEIYHNNIRHFA